MDVKDVNTLTKEQIEEIKAANGGRVFKVQVVDDTFLCRPLYGPDWKVINKLRADNPRISTQEIDEKIVNTCLIGPRPSIEAGGWSGKMAGAIPTLSMSIRAKSGFVVPELDAVPSITDLTEDPPMVKPTENDIKMLKASTDFTIKGIGILSDYFVVRQISRNEFKNCMASQNQEDQDRLITERAVMWPKGTNWDEKGAGYCDTIAQFVLSLSGFTAPTLIEDL